MSGQLRLLKRSPGQLRLLKRPTSAQLRLLKRSPGQLRLLKRSPFGEYFDDLNPQQQQMKRGGLMDGVEMRGEQMLNYGTSYLTWSGV